MSINLDLDVQGLQPVTNLLHTYKAMGSVVQSVELLAHDRGDGGPSNADLLHWHANPEGKAKYPKRDFVTSSTADLEAIAQAAAKEAEMVLAKQLKRDAKYEKLKARSVGGQYKTRTGKMKKLGPPPDLKKRANELASRMMKFGAMYKYMEQVKARIQAVKSNSGSIPEYSDKYEKKKLAKKGFVNPKLVWTGQILENLDSGGIGGKNVQVRRGR